ncbi:transglycosylase SLT domain-containing protein [Vibrio chaetopteri]|uniref:transglycosylase SLT domain-containing protein n=1 Tax=Vibrio chaetopteri TaxID=3016528 RepID=UPI003AB174D1
MRKIVYSALALSIATAFSPVISANSQSFDELDKVVAKKNRPQEEVYREFRDYVNQQFDEYEAWRENYTANLDQQRGELISRWGSAELSDETKDVEYSDDESIRKVIDYDNNTAEISVLVDENVTEEQAKSLVIANAQLPDGSTLAINQADVTQQKVAYSHEQQAKEKVFIVKQTQEQMNEYDIQADRLIAANTGVPESFIYERAHNKKTSLIQEAKQRIAILNAQYQQQRKMLGIPGITDEKVTEKKTAESAPSPEATNEVIHSETDAHVPAIAGGGEPVKETIQAHDVETVEVAKAGEAVEPIQSELVKETAKSEEVSEPKSATIVEVAENEPKQKVITYKIKLPNNSLAKRAAKYQPLALEQSKRWKLDPALVMAIMHSESSFRPMAKSHVPAFGLMQVVPTSAGHDVNRMVRNIDAPMKEAELYQPDFNVETGTAYLHILDTRYLSRITNDESRLYCAIAAYNTGAGNVARAFNSDNSTNIRKAAKIINQMTPKQVYERLIERLPYDETKNYLKKVSSRMSLYEAEPI